MYHGLDGLDIIGYSNKLLAEIQSKQLLTPLTTKHECNNKSSVQIMIATGGIATPHIPGADVKDFGGSVYKTTLETENWEAGAYLDYFLLDDVNFDYKAFIQDRGLADAISMCADQIVIDAMNVTHIREFPYDPSQPLVDLFANCQNAIDSAMDDNPPVEGRKLILPVAARDAMYNDDKFMSSLYIQHQMNNLMDGKAGRLLGFDTLFIPNRKQGGLHYDVQPDGKRLYTCYAVCPGAVHSAEGFGGSRVLNKGGILKVDDIPHKGCYFIYIPYQAGRRWLYTGGS
ncbi:MAG: hypothetical protein LBE98_00605 [Puniceicoccales bacterium]|jgi:hypothetical protein|nr:hypothetical protein [Puniceicoccales bacterium]